LPRAGSTHEEHEFPAGELDVEVLHRGALSAHVRLGDVVETDHECLSRRGMVLPQRRGGAGGIDADVDSVVVKTWSSVRGSAHVAHLCRIRRAPAARASTHVSTLYLTCCASAARASPHVAL